MYMKFGVPPNCKFNELIPVPFFQVFTKKNEMSASVLSWRLRIIFSSSCFHSNSAVCRTDFLATTPCFDRVIPEHLEWESPTSFLGKSYFHT